MRGAKQLVTLRGGEIRRGSEMSDLALIPDGALLIRGDRIEDVGTSRRIERLKASRDAQEVDATGCIVFPAFVDGAARPVCAHARGDSFEKGVQAFREARRIDLESSAESVLAGMARHGTLVAEVLTGYGGDLAGELRLLRIYQSLGTRIATLIPSLALSGHIPESFTGGFREWMEGVMFPLLESAARLRLIHSVTALYGSGGSTLEETRMFLQASQAKGLRTQVLIEGESASPRAAVDLSRGASVVQGLDGAVPEFIPELASSPAIFSLSPGVNYSRGIDNFPPTRALIDAGAAVALATRFSCECNPDYNMLHTMEIACRFTSMSPAEALTAATLNAAHAVGCAQDRGSLVPGKCADLVLFRGADYIDVIRNAAVHSVVRVIRQGATIYRRGQVGGLN